MDSNYLALALICMNDLISFNQKNWCYSRVQNTPTPWLTLLLVLGKSRVKQNSC